MNNGFKSNQPFSVKACATDSRLFAYADLICVICVSRLPIVLSCARLKARAWRRCNYWITGKNGRRKREKEGKRTKEKDKERGREREQSLYCRLYSPGFNMLQRQQRTRCATAEITLDLTYKRHAIVSNGGAPRRCVLDYLDNGGTSTNNGNRFRRPIY